MLNFFIQDAAEDALLLEPEVTEQTLSIMELIVNGGTGGMIIIGTLAILLFVALYVYFEAAKVLCAQQNSPVSRLTEKGISRIGSPLDDINTAIENAGRLEVYKLEKNVSVLATIAGAAPMIGFLGTVIGMVLAFHQLATSSGQAEMGLLAEGIYTAMTTTVAGLIVGIIAYMGYNHLVVKTDKVVHQMEATAVDFLDLLNEPV